MSSALRKTSKRNNMHQTELPKQKLTFDNVQIILSLRKKISHVNAELKGLGFCSFFSQFRSDFQMRR